MAHNESQHEIIVPDTGFPFKLFAFEGMNGKYIREKHWHSSIEIFCVINGEIDFYINDVKMPIKGGNLIIVNSNEVHSVHAPNPNETLILQIPLMQFEKYFTEELFIAFDHNGKDSDGALNYLIKQMYQLVQDKNSGFELLAMSLYYQLIYMLIDRYRQIDVDAQRMQSNRQLRKLSHVTSYIKEHYQEEITLEKLASEFGYAPEYLSRIFVKYAKINYKDYLQNIRLEHAKYDLETTDEQIVDIAMKHGFASSKAFSNTFRKWYGILPNEYRKLHK